VKKEKKEQIRKEGGKARRREGDEERRGTSIVCGMESHRVCVRQINTQASQIRKYQKKAGTLKTLYKTNENGTLTATCPRLIIP